MSDSSATNPNTTNDQVVDFTLGMSDTVALPVDNTLIVDEVPAVRRSGRSHGSSRSRSAQDQETKKIPQSQESQSSQGTYHKLSRPRSRTAESLKILRSSKIEDSSKLGDSSKVEVSSKLGDSSKVSNILQSQETFQFQENFGNQESPSPERLTNPQSSLNSQELVELQQLESDEGYPLIDPFTPTTRTWKKHLSSATTRKTLRSTRERQEKAIEDSQSQMLQYMKNMDQYQFEAAKKRDSDFALLGNNLETSFREIHQRIDSLDTKSQPQIQYEENDRHVQMREDSAYAQRLWNEQKYPQQDLGDIYNFPDPYNIHNFQHDVNYANGNSHSSSQGVPSSTDTYVTVNTGAPTVPHQEPIGNLSYLFRQIPNRGIDNDRNYSNHPQLDYGENNNSKPLHQGLCRLQAPHTLLISFQKSSRMKMVTTNAHTFVDWYQYMKALYTSCYLGCLNHMSPHWVPRDKIGWKNLESTQECRGSCIDAVTKIKDGIIPQAYRGMSIAVLTGIFNAIMLSWPSMVLLINSVLGNSIDSVSLSHVKEIDVVDSYTIRITYFKVVNTFIMSNDNAKTMRLRAFLNKSEYKTSESPNAFASRLLLEQRDINVLYSGPNLGETVISEAMIKETFLDAIKKKTGGLYDNILDNIDNVNLTFTNLVERINNKYMREKSRIVTESLYAVGTVDTPAVDSNANDHAFYSTSSQVPVKRREDKPMDALPCFQMRDKGKCDFGAKCKFSHDQKVLKKPISSSFLMTELGQQNKYLCDQLLLVTKKKFDYKKKFKAANYKKSTATGKKVGFKKPAPQKFFEDIGKSNSAIHKANLAVDGATTEEPSNETSIDNSDNEYTTDGGADSDTSGSRE